MSSGVGVGVFTALGAGLFLIGLILAVWSWRRRRGSDLHCRRCRFSLAGHETPERCPECGAELGAARSTRVGAPQRAKGRLVVGVLLTVVGTGAMITGPVLNAQNLTWLDVAPTWWLIQVELPGASGTRELALLTELTDRAKAGELSADANGELVDFALMRQRDNSVVWNSEWFFFIDAAWAAGELDRDQRLTVVQQTIASSFRGDMGTGPGEAQIALELACGRGRPLGSSGGATAPIVKIRQEYLELVVDGRSQRVGGRTASVGELMSGRSSSSSGRTLRGDRAFPGNRK